MNSGIVIIRKALMDSCIGRLSGEEKMRARKLYAILDKVELLAVIHRYAGVVAIIPLPFLADLVDNQLLNRGGMALLYGLVAIALFYVLAAFILKKFVFNPWCRSEVERLRVLLMSDCDYRATLELLERLDPDMVEDIKNLIAYPA